MLNISNSILWKEHKTKHIRDSVATVFVCTALFYKEAFVRDESCIADQNQWKSCVPHPLNGDMWPVKTITYKGTALPEKVCEPQFSSSSLTNDSTEPVQNWLL